MGRVVGIIMAISLAVGLILVLLSIHYSTNPFTFSIDPIPFIVGIVIAIVGPIIAALIGKNSADC